jgi:hypothetical protein
MKIPFTWKQFERYWYLFSLAVIVASLPFSKLLLSIGQMMIAGGWIVERFDARQLIGKLKPLSWFARILRLIPVSLFLLFNGIFKGFWEFFRNKPALLFSSIFFLHVAGLLFTTDFDYALKDLRTKFPLLLLPLVLSTSKAIDQKTFYRYLLLLVLAVLVRSIFNTWMISAHNYIDIRDVSRNVSHIIFSLLISLCVFILGYFTFRPKLFPTAWRSVFLLCILWLFVYIIISQSFTGLAISMLTLLILIPVLIMTVKNGWIRIGWLGAILIVTVGISLSLRSVVRDYYRVNPVDITKLDSVSSRGNRYIHNLYSKQTENGNYLWHYIQWDEMRGEWNKRSKFPFDSLDLKNQTVAHTVVRFLTSKGWRKDGDAVAKLKEKEVAAIEKGVANYIFLEEFSIRGRIYEFLMGYDEYMKTGNPTGSTVMQRVEFWKASIGIIKDNWLSGVGTGDMNEVFAAQYEKMHSKLSPDQRWRSHNQFLSIWIGFGIFGLLWFVVALFYPPIMMKRTTDYFMAILIIITVLSMMTEDTIESQTGVTFFAMLYSLFLFARYRLPGKKPIN